MNESEFAKYSGFSQIAKYRKQGLIEPKGQALGGTKLSYFYHSDQAEELKKALGITLDDTTGLISEPQIIKAYGLSQIRKYREQGLIEPKGQAQTKGGRVSHFYHPGQAEELKKTLGITLDDTTGLLNETEFAKYCRLRQIGKYRKQGLIKSRGQAQTKGGRVSHFYHPEQKKELNKNLGITLDDTTGLLNETEFAKYSGFSRIARYRKQGLIEPKGRALSGPKLSYFYHPDQAEELKNALGITLDDTTGLVGENQIRKEYGLTNISKYREKGLIEPKGRALSGPGVLNFYRPDQVEELKKTLGITLDDTTGLLNETEFAKYSGFTKIADYRERGLIEPKGYALTNAGLSSFYHPEQREELKKNLGITLDDTTGLVTESQIKKQYGFSQIRKYREQGLIEPEGYALTNAGLSCFYHPRQVEELRRILKEKPSN